jgi:hypothetical protein
MSTVGAILLVVLILLLVGVFPTWPHSAHYGYWPAGGLGVLLIVILILVPVGRL